MNPQLTHLIALERASDLRREAHGHKITAKHGTARHANRILLRLHRAMGAVAHLRPQAA